MSEFSDYYFVILLQLKYRCLPESVRWYVVNGYIDKAEETMHNIARVNGHDYPKDVILEQNHVISHKGGRLLDILKHRSLMAYSVVCLLVW